MAVKALVAGVADMTTKSAPQGSENTMDSEVRKITDYVFQTDMVVGEPYIKLREMITNLIAQEANQAVTSALAKHVLAGMPGLTPRQQDYITKVLAQLTDKKGKA